MSEKYVMLNKTHSDFRALSVHKGFKYVGEYFQTMVTLQEVIQDLLTPAHTVALISD